MLASVSLWLCLWPLAAGAHALAPALLDLQQTAPGRYDVLWRTSVLKVQGETVAPRFPAGCVAGQASAPEVLEGESIASRWPLTCDGAGLSGGRIAVDGLGASGINVIVRIVSSRGAVTERLLDAREPGFAVPGDGPHESVLVQYLRLGVRHLATGLDHLLFVAGLVLLVAASPSPSSSTSDPDARPSRQKPEWKTASSPRKRRSGLPGWRRARALAAAVTAFTLGHSVTLALAALGWVHFDPRLAELGIALTLLFLACEVARPQAAGRSRLGAHPGVMAASFGLVHGLGFAGALAGIGLPDGAIPMALLGFNAGIEIAQLAFVGLLLAAGAAVRRIRSALPGMAVRLGPAYVMGGVAAYWCIERAGVLAG